MQEGILNSSNFILDIMFLRDQTISSSNFGDQFNQLWCVRLIDLDDTFQKGHTTQKYSMAFLLKASGDFGQKLAYVLRDSLYDLDRG